MLRPIQPIIHPLIREYNIVGTASKIVLTLKYGTWNAVKKDYNMDGYCIHAEHITKEEIQHYINN